MKPESTKMVQDKKENKNLLGDIQEPRMICEQFNIKFNSWFTGANAERKTCPMSFTLSDKNKLMFAWRDYYFSALNWGQDIRFMVQEVKRMNSVAYFLKNIRCSLNGHFLCELLIETESMTFSNNSGEAFLRNSELTQSCGFPGQGKTRALGAQKEY